MLEATPAPASTADAATAEPVLAAGGLDATVFADIEPNPGTGTVQPLQGSLDSSPFKGGGSTGAVAAT